MRGNYRRSRALYLLILGSNTCEDPEGRVRRLAHGNRYNVKEMMHVKDLVSMGIGFAGF